MSTNTVKTAPVVNNGAGKSGKDATTTPATTTPATATPATATPAKDTTGVLVEFERAKIDKLGGHRIVFESLLAKSDLAYIDMIRSLSAVVSDVREVWKVYRRAQKWNPADMARFESVFPCFVGAESCDKAIDAYTRTTCKRGLTWWKDQERILKHDVLISQIDSVGVGYAVQMAKEFQDVITLDMCAIAKDLSDAGKIATDKELWLAYYTAKAAFYGDKHAAALAGKKENLAQGYMTQSNEANASRIALESKDASVARGVITPAQTAGTPAQTTGTPAQTAGTPAQTAQTAGNGKLSIEAREKQLDVYYAGIDDKQLVALRDAMYAQMTPVQKRDWMRMGAILIEFDSKNLA